MPVENANHLLNCTHRVGKSGTIFQMKAELLKTMPDGRVKIRVYGDRFWNNSEHKSRIRYVEASRIAPIIFD